MTGEDGMGVSAIGFGSKCVLVAPAGLLVGIGLTFGIGLMVSIGLQADIGSQVGIGSQVVMGLQTGVVSHSSARTSSSIISIDFSGCSSLGG